MMDNVRSRSAGCGVWCACSSKKNTTDENETKEERKVEARFFASIPPRSRARAPPFIIILTMTDETIFTGIRQSPRGPRVLTSSAHTHTAEMENLPEQLKDAVDFAKTLPGAADAQAAIYGGVSTLVHEASKYASVAWDATSVYVETGKAHSGILTARLKEVDEEFFKHPTALLAKAREGGEGGGASRVVHSHTHARTHARTRFFSLDADRVYVVPCTSHLELRPFMKLVKLPVYKKKKGFWSRANEKYDDEIMETSTYPAS